ncbi:MAG: ABC transporter permease [Chitinophagales bacterium]
MDSIISFLLLQKDEMMQIVCLSLFVSGLATILGSMIAIPLGTWLGMTGFPGKKVVMRLVYTLMALPPVLAGLIVYLLLSRSGPMGTLELLFTPAAMITAQFLLVTPIVTGLVAATVAGKERQVYDQARSLGASRGQVMITIVKESRTGIIAGLMTGFGRAFAEVGAVMLVGGNILHQTRVLTTSIVMETRQGNYELAIMLGIILLVISFIVSSVVLANDEMTLS